MAFDKELYNGYRKVMEFNIMPPMFYKGTLKDWVLGWLDSVKEFADNEDYEACAAVKHTVIAFINKYLPEEERMPLDTLIHEELLGYGDKNKK
ncbi:MAG: hypothetical protein PHS04_09840 [Tissierellia bacterium]|nr:hypothetical protein [Tissierellia bacterium]